MADLSITVAEVQPGTGVSFETLVAGEAIDAGETVYKKAADSKAWLADADAAATAEVVGIAVCSAGTGQRVVFQRGGTITLGATASVVVGQTYVQSTTAGKIAVESDPTTGDYMSILGVGKTSSTLAMQINNTGIVHA